MAVRPLMLLALVGLLACGASAAYHPAPARRLPLPPPPPDSVERLAVAGAAGQAAAPDGLITRRVLFGNPHRAAPRISPDGKHLAFLAPDRGVLNVWVAPTGKLAQARPVTADRKRGIRRFFWAFTSQHVVYLQDQAGDENWHAHSVDIRSRKAIDLSPLAGVKARIEQVSRKHPAEIVIGLNDRDRRYYDLHRVNVRTGARALLLRNDQRFGSFAIDDDLRVRFAIQPSRDGGERILRKRGARFVPYAKVGMQDALTTAIVGFDTTGERMYLIDSRGHDTSALTEVTLSGGGEPRVLSQDLRADVDDVLLHPESHAVQAVAASYLRKSWTFLDPSVRDDFAALSAASRGDIQVVSRTLADDRWTVGFATDDGPVRYYLYDRAHRRAALLFVSRPELANLPLATMRPVRIRTRDGLELVSYLTLPLGTAPSEAMVPRRPLPLVLLVHGGPWSRDRWGYDAQHQWLANRGYAVLSVNYRGSTGFGKRFINAGNLEWGGRMQDDLVDAVRWAIGRRIADPARVAIMGGSYGGYTVLAGLTSTPKLFACGVDIVGPSNLVTLLTSIPPYWAPYRALFKQRVGDYHTADGRVALIRASPVHRAHLIERPLLIGQGANDPRVNQDESDQMVRAMGQRNVAVTYVLYPDEGHGFHRPENRMAFQAVSEAFLAKCLGGRAQPFGDDLAGSSIQVPVGAERIAGLTEALAGLRRSATAARRRGGAK